MKRSLIRAAVSLAAALLSAAEGGAPEPKNPPSQEEPALTPAQVSELRKCIPMAARKAAEIRKVRGEDADNLEKLLESLLQAPPGPKDDAKQEPQTGSALLARKLRVPSGSINVAIRLRSGPIAYEFDFSEDGQKASYDALKRQNAPDRRSEILRLCQLAALAADLRLESEWTRWQMEALEQARSWLEENPKSAEARALLAQALMLGGNEDQAQGTREIQEALAVSPDCALAQVLLLERKAHHLSSALLSEPQPPLEQPTMEFGRFLRRLYDEPPSDSAMTALAEQWAAIETEISRVLGTSSLDSKLRFRLASLKFSQGLTAALGEIARQGKASSFADFQQLANRLQLTSQGEAMLRSDWLPEMKAVCNHESEDGQIIVSAALFPIIYTLANSRPAQGKTAWESLPEPVRELMDHALAKATHLGRKEDSPSTARACEASGAAQLLLAGIGGRPLDPGFADLLIRAITLDPGRIVALDCLMGLSSEADPVVSLALGHIRLSMIQTYRSHRQVVAAARTLKDWKTCEKEFAACLEQQPEDLAALNGLIAVRLKETQSAERLKEVGTLVEKAREIYSRKMYALSPEDLEDFIVNYYLFLGLNGDWKAAVELMQQLRQTGQVSEAAADEMLKLAPL